MKLVTCPHCGNHRHVTKVPRDVVVVLPCPACGELVVLFRDKVIALSRRIIEEGTLDEIKAHLANVIAEFLEPGMFRMSGAKPDVPKKEAAAAEDADSDGEGPEESDTRRGPISRAEREYFVKVELNQLDDSAYFKKHFG